MTIPILLSPLAQAIAAWPRTLAPRTLGLRISAVERGLIDNKKYRDMITIANTISKT